LRSIHSGSLLIARFYAGKGVIDKLLLERLALAAIARVTGVSERWLQMYVNQKFYQTPKTVDVSSKKQVG
jgi:hypothetical protein